MKSIVRLGLFLVILLHAHIGYTQDILRGKDLSKINVDVLTDQEIISYRDKLRESGLSEIQAEQLAIQRGMPSSEVIKLKTRLSKIQNSLKSPEIPQQLPRRALDSSIDREFKPPPTPTATTTSATQMSKIFGSELFANNSMTFEPNIRLATPKNYVLGPDDELLIDVYGYQEVNYRLSVSPEGSITIPYVGVIPVSGSSIEQASKRIKDRMIRNGYASLGSGQSKLEVNIGKIKSVRITIVGEAKRAGTYTLSSLSTMFNALYAAGGITDKGSFRKIELIRNNKVINRLDAYNFLLRGDLSQNEGLMDQDVIRIPIAELKVEVTGEVSRPGIFEMLPNENMKDLIDFAGGFKNEAYRAALHIMQLNEKERQLKDVTSDEFDTYVPRKGDVVVVDKVLETYTNRVVIRGAVLRPGQFELTRGLMLSQLIKKAEGLREDAFTDRAILIRTKENMTTEIIPFQVKQVLESPGYDIKLQKEDIITIASIFDYRENYTVTIEGEVRQPGVFNYIENITLKDLLFQAGGLTDAASPQQIEIARRINSDTTGASQHIAEVIEINSERELFTKGAEVKLSPWDIVMVRTKLGYKPQITVRLEGEVLYPGIYVLATKQDRISDLVKRAGGLTPEAYLQGAYLSRINNSGIAKEANIIKIQKIQQQVGDTSNAILSDVTKPIIKVGLDLEKILSNPKIDEDIILQEGDVLNVSKRTYEVMINGEVMFPTQVVFKEGADLRYYIDKAGGFTDDARKKRTYVLYANGNAAKTRKFLFFKSYPVIKPGAEILVPKTPERNRNRLSTAEIVGITSGLATLLTLIITLISIK